MIINIVTVHFRDYEGLKRTYNSISALSASGIDFRWIVIDGGSDFLSHQDLKCDVSRAAYVFVSEPDGGIYDAMNKGISYACDGYTIFMNAGDYFVESNWVEGFLSAVDRSDRPVLIMASSYEYHDVSELNFKACRDIKYLWYGMPTHHQAFFFLTDALREFRYNTVYKIAADYDLICRIYKSYGHPVPIVSEPVCAFELNGLSNERFWAGLREQQSVRSSALGVPLVFNVLVLFVKSFMRVFRVALPGLYRAVRYD